MHGENLKLTLEDFVT